MRPSENQRKLFKFAFIVIIVVIIINKICLSVSRWRCASPSSSTLEKTSAASVSLQFVRDEQYEGCEKVEPYAETIMCDLLIVEIIID